MDNGRLPIADAKQQLQKWDVMTILDHIHNGRLQGIKIPADVRRRCVEHLMHEGLSPVEIAPVLGVSDRTIRRDRTLLRRLGALRPSLTLSDELMGEFQAITQTCMLRMLRLANTPDAPAYARFWALDATARTYNRFLTTARKLGYLEHGHLRRSQLRMQRDDPGAIFMRNMHKLTEFAAHAKIVQSLEAHAKRCQARRAAAAANPPREEARDEALS